MSPHTYIGCRYTHKGADNSYPATQICSCRPLVDEISELQERENAIGLLSRMASTAAGNPASYNEENRRRSFSPTQRTRHLLREAPRLNWRSTRNPGSTCRKPIFR